MSEPKTSAQILTAFNIVYINSNKYITQASEKCLITWFSAIQTMMAHSHINCLITCARNEIVTIYEV